MTVLTVLEIQFAKGRTRRESNVRVPISKATSRVPAPLGRCRNGKGPVKIHPTSMSRPKRALLVVVALAVATSLGFLMDDSYSRLTVGAAVAFAVLTGVYLVLRSRPERAASERTDPTPTDSGAL